MLGLWFGLGLILGLVLGFWVRIMVNLTQTRHNFVGGNPYSFSENLYQSVSFIYASMYRKKWRHCVIKIDSQQPRTKIGALLHVARQSNYDYASD